MSDITVVVADSTPQNVVVSSSTPDITEVVNVGPPGAGGGASYDQSLNTTDSPTFASVYTSDGTLSGGIWPGFDADKTGIYFEDTHAGSMYIHSSLTSGLNYSQTLQPASGTIALKSDITSAISVTGSTAGETLYALLSGIDGANGVYTSNQDGTAWNGPYTMEGSGDAWRIVFPDESEANTIGSDSGATYPAPPWLFNWSGQPAVRVVQCDVNGKEIEPVVRVSSNDTNDPFFGFHETQIHSDHISIDTGIHYQPLENDTRPNSKALLKAEGVSGSFSGGYYNLNESLGSASWSLTKDGVSFADKIHSTSIEHGAINYTTFTGDHHGNPATLEFTLPSKSGTLATETTHVIYASKVASLNSDINDGGGNDDTAALQAVLDLANTEENRSIELVMDGVALVTKLRVWRNTIIRCLPGCGFFQAPYSNWHLLTTGYVLPTEPSHDNISLIGGVYNCNGNNQTKWENDHNHATPPDYWGWNFGIWIGWFKNFTMRDVTIRNAKTFSITLMQGDGVVIENCASLWDDADGATVGKNRDGIHMWGPLANVRVKGYVSNGDDDVLALNTNENTNVSTWPTAQPRRGTGGTLKNLLFEDIEFRNAANGIRFYTDYLTGSGRSVEGVTFRNIHGNLYLIGISDASYVTKTFVEIDGWNVTGHNTIAIQSADRVYLSNIIPTASVNVSATYTFGDGFPQSYPASVITSGTLDEARLPSTAVTTTGTQTLTNKSISSSQITGLATVATSGSYADLTGNPTLGTASSKDIPASGNASATQVVYGSDTRLTNARTPSAHASTHSSGGSDALTLAASQITGLASVATSGAYSALSGTPSLATVATSGSYTDLSNLPVIAKKSTADIASTNTTLADVTGLTGFTLEANTMYRFEFAGRHTCASGGSQYLVLNSTQAIANASAQGWYVIFGSRTDAGFSNPSGNLYAFINRSSTGNTNNPSAAVYYIMTGSSAPTIKIQFSQTGTATGTATLLSGAVAVFTKLI